jgi:hypothetical protein
MKEERVIEMKFFVVFRNGILSHFERNGF